MNVYVPSDAAVVMQQSVGGSIGEQWPLLFTRESRMLRASLPSSGRPSVCLSVRPSHS